MKQKIEIIADLDDKEEPEKWNWQEILSALLHPEPCKVEHVKARTIKPEEKVILTKWDLIEDMTSQSMSGEIWMAQMLGGYIGYAVGDGVGYTATCEMPFTKEEFIEQIKTMHQMEPFFNEDCAGNPVLEIEREPVPTEDRIRIVGPQEMAREGEVNIFDWFYDAAGRK